MIFVVLGMHKSGTTLLARALHELSFDDNTIDAVLSDQVFEHVQSYSESIVEHNRVLKTDGFCLNIFPSRYKPIEPHAYVPLSSVIRLYPWLYLWAVLGIRNKHQASLSATGCSSSVPQKSICMING